ncbi:TonB-dependent receptor [Psychrosphaera sp. 1_MG-2023]|uniref:TonB-dependent receptor n=1 Tax=Psychrosphaera sp. 1_MG-2023 TaxID=3062643 RepID=UPI0026E28346|nr:TonB-dependent receptor [Psychrosphaera sp. 1_MG-2023]MDO6717807.1 TonB-dependent receptor [Psychrosphaera sp. 1_MG-2023]
MTKKFKLSSVALALAFTCSTSNAFAEQKNNNDDNVEKIVVTGTFSGKSVAKKEVSFAISSFSEDDIRKLAPKSTADLFKAVPGVWAESSGGVSGANVFVRGFPGGGDAPFLTVQLQGAPIFPPPTLSFLENSTLFRLDETVVFMDALRGGPNAVVSNGQPGLTTNFILKEGSEDTEGLFKYSTSDYGLQRIDGMISGAIAEDLYFMAGGYIKSSPGIRDAGFNAEQGSQFTLNITKQLDNGKINLYSRITDDHGVWYLPSPLNVDSVDNKYTQIGSKNRLATIKYGPDNTEETVDFGQGRGWNGSVTGGSIDLTLGNDWALVDRFIYTTGDANTYGLVPNEDATALSNVADNGSSAIGAVSGKVYAGDTMVQQIGRWVVKKQIEAFTNDFTLTKTLDNGTFTAGYYHSTFAANDWWSIGNQAYHVIESGGEMLTGIDCNDNLDGCGWNYDINSVGDGATSALYIAASFDVIDGLTIDGGLRNENHKIEYTVDEGLDGAINKAVSYDKTELAYTVGANWMLDKNQGIFARYSDGSKMPFFDDFRDNFGSYQDGEDLIKQVTQFEFGYKMVRNDYELYATTFFNEVKGDTFVSQPGAPAEVLTNEAYGIEIDFNYFTESGLSLSLNSTVQQTEITESPDNRGNEAQRQPGWQIRLTPSYDIDFDNGSWATVYGNISAVGDRFANNENTVTLAGYQKVDLGMILNLTDAVQVQMSVSNLTDENALTEGDPRDSLSSNGRYIMPRTVDLSVSYLF